LTYFEDAVECAFKVAEAGLPTLVASGAVMGGSGPATIAGTAISNNAELVAGVVVAQLIKPGTRTLVVNFVFPQNMRSGAPAFGDIGCALHQVVFNQIWRRYGIPRTGMGSPVSSKRADYQTGYEKMHMALLAALSGSNVIFLHGGIYGEVSHHPVQAILDDDIAGMVGRFIEGVVVNHGTLAIDLIEQVGPIPGFYLDKEHTREWWKKEQFVPKTADRLTYPEWMKAGKKSAIDYAKERIEEILATHKPIALTKNQEQAIHDTLQEAMEYYREKGLISDEDWAVYKKDPESPNYPYA
jgi:trimethylamine--corrinoid protein Co-methyltransferase